METSVPDGPFDHGDDASTPLTAEERQELIPSYITLRHELNEAEQINIGSALRWAYARKRDVLDAKLLNELHRRMFGDVWTWAGRYRTTARNIGVEADRISSDVRQAIDDARTGLITKRIRPMKSPYGLAIALWLFIRFPLVMAAFRASLEIFSLINSVDRRLRGVE